MSAADRVTKAGGARGASSFPSSTRRGTGTEEKTHRAASGLRRSNVPLSRGGKGPSSHLTRPTAASAGRTTAAQSKATTSSRPQGKKPPVKQRAPKQITQKPRKAEEEKTESVARPYLQGGKKSKETISTEEQASKEILVEQEAPEEHKTNETVLERLERQKRGLEVELSVYSKEQEEIQKKIAELEKKIEETQGLEDLTEKRRKKLLQDYREQRAQLEEALSEAAKTQEDIVREKSLLEIRIKEARGLKEFREQMQRENEEQRARLRAKREESSAKIEGRNDEGLITTLEEAGKAILAANTRRKKLEEGIAKIGPATPERPLPPPSYDRALFAAQMKQGRRRQPSPPSKNPLAEIVRYSMEMAQKYKPILEEAGSSLEVRDVSPPESPEAIETPAGPRYYLDAHALNRMFGKTSEMAKVEIDGVSLSLVRIDVSVEEIAARPAADFEKFSWLRLDGCTIDPAVFNVLCGKLRRGLDWVTLFICPEVTGLEALHGFPLRRLELDSYGQKTRGEIAALLEKNRDTLEEVRFFGASIGEEQDDPIPATLAHLSQLKILDLSCSDLTMDILYRVLGGISALETAILKGCTTESRNRWLTNEEIKVLQTLYSSKQIVYDPAKLQDIADQAAFAEFSSSAALSDPNLPDPQEAGVISQNPLSSRDRSRSAPLTSNPNRHQSAQSRFLTDEDTIYLEDGEVPDGFFLHPDKPRPRSVSDPGPHSRGREASIPREIEESEIGQGGSPDFLAGARGIAASQDPKRGRKIWDETDAGQNRLFSHERYNSTPPVTVRRRVEEAPAENEAFPEVFLGNVPPGRTLQLSSSADPQSYPLGFFPGLSGEDARIGTLLPAPSDDPRLARLESAQEGALASGSSSAAAQNPPEEIHGSSQRPNIASGPQNAAQSHSQGLQENSLSLGDDLPPIFEPPPALFPPPNPASNSQATHAQKLSDWKDLSWVQIVEKETEINGFSYALYLQEFMGGKDAILEKDFYTYMERCDQTRLREFYTTRLAEYEITPPKGESLYTLEALLQTARNLWVFAEKVIKPELSLAERLFGTKPSKILPKLLTKLAEKKNALSYTKAIIIKKLEIKNSNLPWLIPQCLKGSIWHHLHTLDASSNRIQNLELSFIIQTPGIKIVNLSHNWISELPHDRWGGSIMEYWNMVEELDLSYNRFRRFPFDFPDTQHGLKRLILTGNPIPRGELLEQKEKLGNMGVELVIDAPLQEEEKKA